MATEIQRIANGAARELAPIAAGDGFQALDVYAGGAVADTAQLPILATISAGDRDERGYPRASRDGRIILHDPEGRCPGFKERLEAGGYKTLTVAPPWNERGKWIQQRFKRYSARRLEVYGDAHQVTEILTHEEKDRNGKAVLVADGHQSWPHGSQEYARLVATCKVETRILFLLAGWDGERPRLDWPDGLGVYALRTTSRHTVNALLGTLALLQGWTGGRIAGVPFELRLTYPEVARPTGERTKVPVWSFTFRPPAGLSLTGRSFRDLVGTALAEAERMQLRELPAASEETLETAELDDPEPELIERAARGDVANVPYWRERWHAQASETWLDDKEERADFLRWFTQGQHVSLALFLDSATNEQADALCAAAARALATQDVESVGEWVAWLADQDDALVSALLRRRRGLLMAAEQAVAHQHDWQKVGPCSHPHATGHQAGDAYRCASCGRYGHKITLYLCGAQAKHGEPLPPQLCPLVDLATWEAWQDDALGADPPAESGPDDVGIEAASVDLAEIVDAEPDEDDPPTLDELIEAEAAVPSDAERRRDQPEADPLREAADAGTKALRLLASDHLSKPDAQGALSPDQASRLVKMLVGLGVALDDVDRFLAVVFEVPYPGLPNVRIGHARAVSAWSAGKESKSQAAAIVAIHGGKVRA